MKKFFIIISAFFFVLLVAAELYVQSDAFSVRIRPYVIRPLQRILGSEARIGWVRANLVPLYIEVRDISLPDEAGRQAAAVRKIKVYINPLPLLLKKIRLPSIVVLEPQIDAERAKDGTWNLGPIVKRITSNVENMKANGPSGFSILSKTITVNQGRISFKDGLTGSTVSVSEIRAHAKMTASADNMTLQIRNAAVHAVAPSCSELAGTMNAGIRYERGRFHIESLEVQTADTVISLSGAVGALPDPDLDLRLKAHSGPQTIGKFTGLLKYFKKERRPRIEASASLKGKLSNPSAEGNITIAGFSYQAFTLQDASLSYTYRDRHLEINGEKWRVAKGNKGIVIDGIKAGFGYRERGLDIRSIAVEAGDLSLLLSGRADPERGLDAVLAVESKNQGQSLSLLTSVPIEGNIRVKGPVTGTVKQPLFDGTFSADPLVVRGISFDNASGRLLYSDKKISAVSVDVHQRSARFFFSGSVDLSQKEPVLAAKLKVIGSDVGTIVALFYKPLPLHFTATGDLGFNGTVHDFTGSGRLTLDSGTAYRESFTGGTITAALTKDKIFFPEVMVTKGNGTVKGTGWIGFDGTYSAAVESHGVKLAEVDLLAGFRVDGLFDLTIDSSGSFAHPEVTASLGMDDLVVNQTALGGVSAGLHIGDKVLTCRAELANERAGMTGRLALTKPYVWTLQSTVSADGVDPLPLLGKKELSGRARISAGGSLALRGSGSDLSALAGTASFDRVEVLVGDYRIDNKGPVAVSIKGDRFSISSLNLSGQGTQMAITGGGRFLKDYDVQLRGAANLSLLRPLFREIEHSDGIAEVTLAIRDSWKNPDVEGKLQITNGEIKIKDIPHKFSAISAKLTFDPSRLIIDSFAGQFGGGTMNGSGKAQLDGLALRDFSSRVVFENVGVRFPEGLTSTLSGELYYDGDASEQSVTGDVLIKRARYDKRVQWKSMLLDIGKGLYQKKKTEAGWIGDTQINIRFYGKDSIIFQNNLAKMPLDVDVFLRGTVNHPQILGRIEARKGSVYFRQNDFKILHASVDFVDPNRMNPVLDIQAQIQVRDHLIRLAVSGTSDRAVVTLLSEPPLPDSDILALLALGKTGEELRGREAGVGMSEAASFATGPVQDIFESRARSLTGLDRFQVDPYVSKGDMSVPRVTVGKEIVQDKLYVTYSSNVGSATPEQIFRIEYILNKHFSLVGERNELGNTGADIKYRFEFK